MGANHMAEQLRNWSPGRAVLPPDPGGHNRMLDRAAAEHLRAVAPHLATSAPAPPQPEPVSRMDTLAALDRREGPGADPAPAPPADTKGEMSREAFREELDRLWLNGNCGDGGAELKGTVMAYVDRLRTRASEVEEARRMIAGVQPDDRAALAVNILRVWPRAEIETFARHLLGDREQESLLLGQLQTQLEIVTRERDEAREQRNDLSRENNGLRYQRDDLTSDLAAADAEREAWRSALRSRFTDCPDDPEMAGTVLGAYVRTTDSANESLRERLAAAEAEVKRLKEAVLPAEQAAFARGTRVAKERVAELEAEVKRLNAYNNPDLDATDGAHPAWWRGNDAGVAGAVRIINEALDDPLPLPGCVGGADLEAVRQRVAALRAAREVAK